MTDKPLLLALVLCQIQSTQVLCDHIVKGYSLNEQRLREESVKLQAMRQTVELLARTLTNQ